MKLWTLCENNADEQVCPLPDWKVQFEAINGTSVPLNLNSCRFSNVFLNRIHSLLSSPSNLEVLQSFSHQKSGKHNFVYVGLFSLKWGPACKSLACSKKWRRWCKNGCSHCAGKSFIRKKLTQTRPDLQCFISCNHNLKYSLTKTNHKVGIT